MDQQIRDNPPAKPGAPRDAPDLVPGLPPGQNLALRTASRGTRDPQHPPPGAVPGLSQAFPGLSGPPLRGGGPPLRGGSQAFLGLIRSPRPVPGLSQACPDPPSGGVPRPFPGLSQGQNLALRSPPDPPSGGGGGRLPLYKRLTVVFFDVKTRKRRLN